MAITVGHGIAARATARGQAMADYCYQFRHCRVAVARSPMPAMRIANIFMLRDSECRYYIMLATRRR